MGTVTGLLGLWLILLLAGIWMRRMRWVVLPELALLNIATFFVYWRDKLAAEEETTRIGRLAGTAGAAAQDHQAQLSGCHIAQQRLLQIQPVVEAMGSKDISDASVETLDQAIGSGGSGLGQAVLNAQADAQLIELVFSGGLPGARSKEPIGELFAVVGEHLLNAHRTGQVHRVQKRLGAGRRPCSS